MDCQPSIIIIDEVEALASRREDMRFDAIMRNICTQFLHMMDTITGTNTTVIATTSRVTMVDESLFSANRLGKQVRLKAPGEKDREEILKIIAKVPLVDESIGCKTHRIDDQRVYRADLNHLIQEGLLEKIRRMPNYKDYQKTDGLPNQYEKLKITTGSDCGSPKG